MIRAAAQTNSAPIHVIKVIGMRPNQNAQNEK